MAPKYRDAVPQKKKKKKVPLAPQGAHDRGPIPKVTTERLDTMLAWSLEQYPYSLDTT